MPGQGCLRINAEVKLPWYKCRSNAARAPIEMEEKMRKMELIAPCHFGLEAVLRREITDLGYEISEVEDGRIADGGARADQGRQLSCGDL